MQFYLHIACNLFLLVLVYWEILVIQSSRHPFLLVELVVNFIRSLYDKFVEKLLGP